jgi:hypothetical protein
MVRFINIGAQPSFVRIAHPARKDAATFSTPHAPRPVFERARQAALFDGSEIFC